MAPVVETRSLSKRYGAVHAVRDVDLSIERGEVFGLLGPNGAGKSTMIRMITGLTRPTSGRVFVAGHDVRDAPVAVKRVVGLAPEVPNLYGELSAWDNLAFSARLHDVPRGERAGKIKEVLGHVGLGDRARDKTGSFSKGMKKRLQIAAAMLHDPELLVLDEPTSGLDVQSARRVWDMVSSCRQRGTTVVIATHFLHEADRFCTRVGIMHEGKLLAVDAPESIKVMVQGSRVIEVSFDAHVDTIHPGDITGVSSITSHGDKHRLVVDDVPAAVEGLVTLARTRGAGITSIRTVDPSLEDAFVQLTGMDLGTMEPGE